MRGSADSANYFSNSIENITQFKTGVVAPGAHNILVSIDDGVLPYELVKDLIIYGEKSIYAEYFYSP